MEKPITLTFRSDEELIALFLTALRLAGLSPRAIQQTSENFLNHSQAAEFLQIPKSTLYSYTSNRLIPHYKRGKRLVFKKSDLEAWLSENRKKTVSEIESEAYSFQNKRGDKK